MKSIKLLATFLMLLFFAGTSFAQSLEVSGTVSDSETGETLPFAYVQIKGTTTGTQTDMDGRYTIETPANATLVYIFTGYVTQEVPVNSRSLIDVALDAEAVSLDDVLVVAYGTAKKESFTGSAEVIKSDKLEKRTVANVTKALDGLTTGVISTSGSGQPGAGASVIIRGYGSLSASTTPLYVVDGIPYQGRLCRSALRSPRSQRSCDDNHKARPGGYAQRTAEGQLEHSFTRHPPLRDHELV